MILHPKEILDNNNHYQFKAEANASLEYQLEKLIFLCEKMGKLLDAQEKSHFHYFTDKECQYAIDSIIHNHGSHTLNDAGISGGIAGRLQDCDDS